ncbi:hypothetical protein AB1Y20_016603 [Prymnesium parvum]|uniref:JmjC domain-containing protein n=1 Tax=Prymnesium parvum TaxID=97485 RepID=A0AB34IE07_PRYPA
MATTWCCVAAPPHAKGVKDELKARGWLDPALRSAQLDGDIAFPVLAPCVAALLAHASALTARVEQLPSARFPPKRTRPAQPDAQDPDAREPDAPRQPRSFGGGLAGAGGGGAGGGLPAAAAVRRVECGAAADAAWLEAHVFSRREPAVLVGLELGACAGGWSAPRLAAARCTHDEVSVHVCAAKAVDLAGHRPPRTPRNFEFRSMPFAEAVARCAADGAAGGALPTFAPLLAEGERYYLRSVGADPKKDAADFPTLFPELARECRLLPDSSEQPQGVGEGEEPRPPRAALLRAEAYHSSVLRLASHDTQLWTHFDVMDNALAQLHGRKRVVLWPPSEDENLYVEGSSSRVSCIDRYNDLEFPRYRRAVHARQEAFLEPGDVLFLPALWFHNVTSIGFSVAINVFWRSHHGYNQLLPRSHSDVYGKDLYGNRDPPAASAALDSAAAAAKALRKLPEPFKSFYARRAAAILLECCENKSDASLVGGGEPSVDRDRVRSTAHLSNGCRMPLVGFGTRELSAGRVGAAVRAAIRAGVRHFDCAAAHHNESAVGAALHEAMVCGDVRREQLWITSKLWNGEHDNVREACLRSLKELRLDFLDLYLVHWPVASGKSVGTPLAHTWWQMEALVTDGHVRTIGVSNFSVPILKSLCERASITPAVNQVELHPGFRNDTLRAFCEARGIHVTAYAPLGSSDDPQSMSLLHSAPICDLAAAHDCTPARLLLTWALRRGCSVIPSSTDAEHIAENASALTHEGVLLEDSTLDQLPQRRRHIGNDVFSAQKEYQTLAALWGESLGADADDASHGTQVELS